MGVVLIIGGILAFLILVAVYSCVVVGSRADK